MTGFNVTQHSSNQSFGYLIFQKKILNPFTFLYQGRKLFPIYCYSQHAGSVLYFIAIYFSLFGVFKFFLSHSSDILYRFTRFMDSNTGRQSNVLVMSHILPKTVGNKGGNINDLIPGAKKEQIISTSKNDIYIGKIIL